MLYFVSFIFIFISVWVGNAALALFLGIILASLKEVGLLEYRERASSDLSMGQLKRLAIAKWLLDEQEIYLIDEPFASLDEEGTLLVSSIIKKLNLKGYSFLFTSHTSSNIDSREILLDNYS